MEKRLFQILDEMNLSDCENNTNFVAVCNEFVSLNKSKKGVIISMGAPESVTFEILEGKIIPILILVDKKEYQKRDTK